MNPRYPLTPMQLAMVLHQAAVPEDGLFIQQFTIDFLEGVNVRLLQQAWQSCVDRHDVLRTRFFLNLPEGPVQEVLQRMASSWLELDWAHLENVEQMLQWKSFLRQDKLNGFSLSEETLWRMTLVRLSQDHYRLIWTSHHAILDGRSRRLVLQEFLDYYDHFLLGRMNELPSLPSFGDHARWLAAQDFMASKAYWKNLLTGFASPTPLPMARLPPAVLPPGEERHYIQNLTLTRKLSSELQALVRANAITFNTLLQGAWSILLAYYSGTEDLVFGATRACRRSSIPQTETMVGLLINTLPVRALVSLSAPLLPWLKQLRIQWLEMRPHEHTPLTNILGWSEVSGNTPLFDTLVVFEEVSLQDSLAKLGQNRRFQLHGTTNFPLVLSGLGGATIQIELTTDRQRIEDKDAQRILQHLHNLLKEIASNPNRSLGDLPILPAEEWQQLVVQWNKTYSTLPHLDSLPGLFAGQASRTPDAIALISHGKQINYRELNEKANRLAHALLRLGVAPAMPVAILLERSEILVIAMLAITKASGIYVPLDSANPPERLELILEDTQACLILTEKSMQHLLPQQNHQFILMDDWESTLPADILTNPPSGLTGESPCYIMYTSGSTGVPKGVAISHRGIIRLLFGIDYVNLQGGRTILQMAPAAFDASTFEIWGALLHGGCCVLAPAQLPSFEELGQLLQKYHVDTAWLTSALFNAIIDESPRVLSGLQQLLIGGEALSVSHVRRALARLPTTRLINGYGPTETTTFACCYPIPSSLPQESTTIPIGKPIGNTTVYLLNANGKPVPIGAPGEIYIGGPGVALGYWRKPDLTAERFIPDPFDLHSEYRLYRTGDQARWTAEGNLIYLGRLDHQVKIRGFRIELSEIETAIANSTEYTNVVVMAREHETGEKRLVAYIAAEKLDVASIRHCLLEKLPDYMVPSLYVRLDRLPLNPNGKVDRKALPLPARDTTSGAQFYQAPRNQVEEAIATVFTRILGLERIGIEEHFFDLGGNSLLAMRAATQIQHDLRVNVPLAALLTAPTIAQLATLVSSTVPSVGLPAAESHWPPPRVDRGKPQPMMYTQLVYWKDWIANHQMPSRNITRAYRIQGPLDRSALDQAMTALIVRHEILRTNFLAVDGIPCQQVNSPQQKLIPINLSHLTPADQSAQMVKLAVDQSRTPFDLTQDSLFLPLLIQLDEQNHVLVLTIHHILVDGWSLRILHHDLSVLYLGYSQGCTPDMPMIPFQPLDLGVWEKESYQGPVRRRHTDFWQKQLDNLLPQGLPPGDGPRADSTNNISVPYSIAIDESLLNSLRQMARKEGVTLSTLLLTGLSLVIYKATGRIDIGFQSQFVARTVSEMQWIVGLLRKITFLRCDLSGRPTLRQLTHRLREMTNASYAHMEYPVEFACRRWSKFDPDYTANIRMQFNYIEDLEKDFELGAVSVSPLQLPPLLTSGIGLDFMIVVQKAHMKIQLKCHRITYSEANALDFLESYRSMLQLLVDQPDNQLPMSEGKQG